MSDSERLLLKPPPKRRRILDPSAIVPVPVYSSKVSSSLQMKPKVSLLTPKEVTDGLWCDLSHQRKAADVVTLSESDDEVEEKRPEQTATVRAVHCPSPPTPESPVPRQSRKAKLKLSEIDRKLQVLDVLLAPETSGAATTGAATRTSRSSCRRHKSVPSQDDLVCVVSPRSESPSASDSAVREIPLKIRCRTDVHKIPVLPSMSLSAVVTKLSVILNVPPPRLLLLKDDMELPVHATVQELGLGIADIIECVVMTLEDKDGGGSDSAITVRLQSNSKDSYQEFSLHREEPLGPIFTQFLSRLPVGGRRNVSFQFDGCKITEWQSPAQLDMEDGDIIEVWT